MAQRRISVKATASVQSPRFPMDPGRLQRVEALYNEALSRAAEDRAAFLAEVCGEDVTLRQEVEALLSDGASSFLRTPAAAATPSLTTGPTQTAAPRPPLASGETELGHWGELKLIDEIGRGGFGRVYRAWDDALAREVALKIIKPRNPAHLASTLKEGQMLASVRHQNIVTVHRAQQIGDEVGLTMELIRGRHLAELVRSGGPMSADEAGVIGVSLCRALAAVHGAKLLHRDLKAHNVMREAGGRIVLMDFGAGREVTPDKNAPHADLAGTPLYLAPELFVGRPASAASDIYSLGVLLFFLVTRKYPVNGRNLADIALMHSQSRRLLLSDCSPDLPYSFVHVVERALASKPDLRPQSAGAMMAELREAMPGLSVAELTPQAAYRAGLESGVAMRDAPRRMSTTAKLVVGGLAAIVAVGLFGLLSTMEYNRMLGRDPGFSDENLAQSWVWGARSLLPPIVYAVLVLIVMRTAAGLWHLAKRIVPPLSRAGDAARTSVSGVFARLRGPDAASAAQALLVVQIGAVVAVVWIFFDVFAALTYTLNDAEPGAFDILDPGPHNTKLYWHPIVLWLLVAAMSTAWYRLLRNPIWRAEIPKTTIGAGLGLILLIVIVNELPYRIFFQSSFPEVQYNGQRCFETGKRDTQVLIYCPDGSPGDRNHIVPSSEISEKTIEPRRIFAPRTPPAPAPANK